MAGDTYLFIDGEYLRQIHREAMRDFFGTDGELDIHEAKRQAGAIRAIRQYANIRSFVVRRMQDLRAVLNSDVGHVRAELAKHIDQITLTPTGDAYVASGTWNFVGRGSIDGAGGPAPPISVLPRLTDAGIGGVDPYAAHPPSPRAACQIVDTLRASSGILVKGLLDRGPQHLAGCPRRLRAFDFN